MIEVKRVNHIYRQGLENEVIALKEVQLTIQKGEYLIVIGHNGSGKSTLAKHLNGLLIPTEGNVEVCGMNTKDHEKIWSIRQKVGMIFQNPDNQIVATAVEEDVAFALENLGVPPMEIRERVDKALKQVHLSDFTRHEPHLLSGGQKQRVAIAGVLAMEPDYLVLDEPTSMLDPQGRAEVMEILRALNKEKGVTIIHITHFVDECLGADRIVVMDKGTIGWEGPPRSLLSNLELLEEMEISPPPVVQLIHLLALRGLSIPTNLLTEQEVVDALCSLS